MIYDLPFNAIFMAEQGEGKLVFLDQPLLTSLWLGYQQRRSRLPELLGNFLHQIKNDGRYEKLYNKWFESTSWRKNM